MRGFDPIIAQKTTFVYPQITQGIKGIIFKDEFMRESINPTNAVTLYATAATGAGSVGINLNRYANLAVEAVLNSTATMRTQAMGFNVVPAFIDSRTQVVIDTLFYVDSVANIQSFAGLYRGYTSMTGLPGVAIHAGVQLDTSASANFFLTSGNGAAQVTTDVGAAATTGWYRLNITQTGDNAATISFYNATGGFTNLLKSQTVTALGQGNEGIPMHWFCKTLAGAAKNMYINEWMAQVN